ncbi:hypothetical protein GEMRC1_013680 [Eukaryota sp. GEM-RC1]
MDSSSLLQFDSDSTTGVSHQGKLSKKISPDSPCCFCISILLIIIAAVVSCALVLYFQYSPPSPPGPLDIATYVVKQINGTSISLWSEIYKVGEMDDCLNERINSTLQNEPHNLKDIEVSTRYLKAVLDRKLTLFDITLTLKNQTSTIQLLTLTMMMN